MIYFNFLTILRMDPYLIHSGIVGMNSVWNSSFRRAVQKKTDDADPSEDLLDYTLL